MSLNDNFCIASMPDDIFFNVSEKKKTFFNTLLILMKELFYLSLMIDFWFKDCCWHIESKIEEAFSIEMG